MKELDKQRCERVKQLAKSLDPTRYENSNEYYLYRDTEAKQEFINIWMEDTTLQSLTVKAALQMLSLAHTFKYVSDYEMLTNIRTILYD